MLLWTTSALGMENIHAYEQELVSVLASKLSGDGLTVYGPEDLASMCSVVALYH